MTSEDLAACLALFDWQANALPMAEDGGVELVI